MNQTLKRVALSAAFAACLLAPGAALADIITTTDGRMIRGIVDPTSQQADQVIIRTAFGTNSIPRARIREIKQESESAGYVHIGRDQLTRNNLAEALRAFQQARDRDAQNAEAQRLLDETQARLDDQKKLNRTEAISQIDQLREQARKLIEEEDFTKAEQMLVDAGKLVPTPEQRAQIKDLISNLYMAWGRSREDKLDPLGAEQKYELAIAANENNEQAINRLLLLWESNPEKKEQSARIYEKFIEIHPENANLRLKLAGLYFELGKYEDASHHYLELYKSSEQYRGTDVEVRLMETLDRLHLQYAREKQYDKAIQYYNMLAAIDPQTDPGGAVYYEYLRRSNSLPADDADARFELATFAEQNGLDEQALQNYRQLLQVEDAKEKAQAALDRYAQRRLTDATTQFRNGNYMLARTLAEQVRQEFPGSEAVQKDIAELINYSDAQLQQMRQASRDRAVDLLRDADEFKRQGDAYFNQIFYTQRRDIAYLSNPREEAKRYYRLAIQTYEEALRIDPSLAQRDGSPVMIRVQEARQRLTRLTTAPLGRQNFGTPINTPESSIPDIER